MPWKRLCSGAVGLRLSVAFDTVDYSILCRQLQLSFKLDFPVLAWFHSYLHGRAAQCVLRGPFMSSSVQLVCGVSESQGSVLGPVLFIVVYIVQIWSR